MRALVAVALLAGCYDPAYEDCAISCESSNVCPAGLSCVEGVCRSSTAPCTGSGTEGWRFRKKGTLKSTTPNALTDFPVAIRIDADPDLANFAQPAGQDLRFTTVDDRPLAYEIERYDERTGELVAWVKFPSVEANPATEFYLIYGNETAADAQSSEAVWTQGYLGVWHMNDGPGTSIADSRGTFPGMKGVANTPSAISTGIVGGAQQFSGTNDVVDIGSSNDFTSTELTLEMWVNVQTNTMDYRRLFVLPNTFPNRTFVMYPLSGAATGVGDSVIVARGSTQLVSAPGSLKPGLWHHLAIVFGDGSAVMPPLVYLDGTRLTMQALQTNIPIQNSAVTFGGDSFVDRATQGLIDEVRISNVNRDAGWISASHDNQREGSTFVQFGGAEAIP